MQHTFHCHLSKSFRWYKNWHTHPQHQHAHWSIFVIITFFISSFISGSINSTGQFYSEQNSALAQTGLTLGISGDRFTINGNPQFLLFISYFDAMNASDAILDSDFARLQSLGFNGIRIITNWNPPGNPGQLMDANGNLRPGMLNRLINIIQKAQNHGLIVDVTFTRDTVPGLSVPNYKNGLVATAQGLTAYRNLYFDIGNEADHDGTTCGSARLCPAEARQIRDAIKAVDSQRIISVSLSSDSGNEPSYVINGAMDFHPTHGPFSTFNGTRAFVSGEKAAVPGKPVHLQEPDRCRSNPCSYSANAFITSATDAKCSGAAGWNFHTRAGYDLTAYTLFNSWLDPNIENGVVNGLASSLANTSWNSCGSSVPPPPPPTGPPPPSPNGVSGQYQCSPSGRDVPGYIGLAGANASFVDPAILSPGWYCDEDSGIDGSVTGLNFPVQAILTCSASSGTAFVTDDVWNHCNDTPGWDFSTYPPTKNGQSVQFIATVNCPGTVTFTLAHGNITAGAWTQSPAVEGLVCARGTVISTQPPPPPPPPPDTPRQCAFGGGPQCSDWGSGSNTSQWCACEFLCTGTNVNPACLTPPPPPPPPPEPTAAESPIITSINPLTVYPGDTIEIIGEFLGTTVQFTDTTGQSSYATGIISDDQRIVTVTVPDGLPAGTYTVSIINPNDIATASDVLTILEIQNFIGPNAQSLEPPTTASTFQDLISNSFNYAIMFVGIAVFIMILWAGFLWVTSAANPGNIATAKGYIFNAIMGGILLLSAYVILYTINPELVGGEFNLKGIDVPPPIEVIPPPSDGNVISNIGCGSNQQFAQDLLTDLGSSNFSQSAGCGGNNHAYQNIQDMAAGLCPSVCANQCSPACTAGGPTGNITVDPEILEALSTLRTGRGIRFTVTSFTTGDHSLTSYHYAGRAVDIVPVQANSGDWSEAKLFLNSIGGTAICEIAGKVIPKCDDFSSGAHIHWQK